MAEVDEGLIESVNALGRLLEAARGAFLGVPQVAIRAIPGCDHASVSMLGADGAVTTVSASDDRTIRLDALQYRYDRGPCLSAIRTGEAVQVDEFATDTRFPDFSSAAVAEGVGSSLSLPLVAGSETLGGLNLYGARAHAYSEASLTAGQEIAGQASVVVASARAYERSVKLLDQLRVAIGSRAEIEQAKGILMSRSNCDADQAFDILRRASQRQNVKLREVAHTIVVNTAAGNTDMRPNDRL